MRELSTRVKVARAIKRELKTAFPKTKFSVKSRCNSWSDAVDVCWTDGPTHQEVRCSVTDKYKCNYNNVRADIPQVRYVTETRSVSHDKHNKTTT